MFTRIMKFRSPSCIIWSRVWDLGESGAPADMHGCELRWQCEQGGALVNTGDTYTLPATHFLLVFQFLPGLNLYQSVGYELETSIWGICDRHKGLSQWWLKWHTETFWFCFVENLTIWKHISLIKKR